MAAAIENEGMCGRVVKVEVVDPKVKGFGLQKFIDYEVRTTWKGSVSSTAVSTCVRRRYRDFQWLNDEFENEQSFELPKKHFFGNLNMSYTDENNIEIRRIQLEEYLNYVCLSCWDEPSLHMFLGGGDHVFAEGKINLDSFRRYLNMPIAFSLEDEIQKAVYTLLNMVESYDMEDFASELLEGCAGIAFLTTMKGGFLYSGRFGSGIVISRLPNGSWSAPSAIAAVGVGWGLQMGCEISDVMLVLPDQRSVDLFTSNVQVSMGSELSMSCGLIGRAVESSVHIGDQGSSTGILSYSYSKGVFIGASVQLSCVISRPDINTAFYGSDISATDILNGRCESPPAALPLYRALTRAHVDLVQHRSCLHTCNDEIYYGQTPALLLGKTHIASQMGHHTGHHVGTWRRTRNQRLNNQIIDSEVATATVVNVFGLEDEVVEEVQLELQLQLEEQEREEKEQDSEETEQETEQEEEEEEETDEEGEQETEQEGEQEEEGEQESGACVVPEARPVVIEGYVDEYERRYRAARTMRHRTFPHRFYSFT